MQFAQALKIILVLILMVSSIPASLLGETNIETKLESEIDLDPNINQAPLHQDVIFHVVVLDTLQNPKPRHIQLQIELTDVLLTSHKISLPPPQKG
jgi:hypothetical protein